MPAEADAWKRMVLRSMPPPAWLSSDAPHGDVVLSSRARIMRNIAGYRFPHRAERDELEEILKRTLQALRDEKLDLDTHRQVSNAEREHLVACRLSSHHFDMNAPGRALLLDKPRSVSLMVNEEDHLRLQSLAAGWAIKSAAAQADLVLKHLGSRLPFARSPRFGYLAASPYNAGEGRRLSSMFHLIGLAQSRRLPAVLRALSHRGLTARGLFGEASRAIGAFVQVSVTSPSPTAVPTKTKSSDWMADFVGACEYLMKEERSARAAVGRQVLEKKAREAVEFAVASPGIALADATRVLAWVRWAAVAGLSIPGLKAPRPAPRHIDALLTTIELRPGMAEDKAAQRRAAFLRDTLGA